MNNSRHFQGFRTAFRGCVSLEKISVIYRK
nr:MAG TPA: hypothetical protein [Caudoviricetes sp.]